MITGQIHRATDFETGFPIDFARIGKHWQANPYIHDDQALVVNLRGKGLVVLTGCGHAGVINTVRQARALSGVERVHAIIGGFHLSGTLFEPVIAPTVAALREIARDDRAGALHGMARDPFDRTRISRSLRAKQRRHAFRAVKKVLT